MVGLWGAAMLFASLPACGSSSGKCTTNCTDGAAVGGSGGKHDAGGTGGTGGSKQDAAADHASQKDAPSPQDAASDGKRDAKEPVDLANTCAESLAAACSATHDAGGFSVHCASTWDATTRNTYLCGRPLTTVFLTTCGSYRELIDTNGNDEYIYVYDAAGNLVAVTHGQYQEGGVATHCVGGSAGYLDPQGCGTSTVFSCAKDGGTHG
jgi:hypothetical protein